MQDILIAQLQAEARELLTRGLVRRYIRQTEALASPRGRIAMENLARSRAPASTTLPCTHHPRSSDTLLNRIVRAGLEHARRLTQAQELKQRVARTAQLYADLARPIELTSDGLRAAERTLDRLTVAYAPVLRLIRLIHDGSRLDLDGRKTLKLSGFLFDMNRFFQALLSRFLRESLSDHDVVDELPLRDLMAYSPGFNPQNRRAPLPRPDFVVRSTKRAPQLLDAKYRDIWENDLPREMLYQLAVYAMSQPSEGTVAILYPTEAVAARESIIEVREPASFEVRAFVALRPVIIPKLLELLRGGQEQERQLLAAALVHGSSVSGATAVE